MTEILAVDLAAKLSAVVRRELGGTVTGQFDSRNKSAREFCREVVSAAKDCVFIVVEDVPYGISSQAMVKPVLRLQGALMAHLGAVNYLERTVFISPSVWMKEFPGVQYASRGLSKAAADKERIETAAHYAKEAGYEPPDLVAEWIANLPEGKKVLKKDTNMLEKSMTDYVSAFLMTEFASKYTFEELCAMKGAEKAKFSI